MASSAAGQNRPPQINPLPDRTIGEQIELTFSVVATDPDVPSQKLTLTLGAGAFSGATLNATNGLFSWTPNEAVGPGTNLFSVIVTDDGSPSLSATQRFTVFILEVNRAPIVDAISDRTINEGEFLVVSVLATDPDLPVQSLSYLLGEGAPATMNLSPVGLITWATDESHGPGAYPVTVMVTDNGSPSLTTTQKFSVVVAELNSLPALSPVEDKTIREGEPLLISLQGSDSDVPAQTLTYTLGAGAPEGVTIDPSTGVLNWTPTESQGPGVYQIGLLVTDDGTPPLSAARSFIATVTEVNRSPEIALIEDKVINVGGFLVFTVPAIDEDIPRQSLTYELGAGAPAGVEVSVGGLFTWTPSVAQVFTTNLVALVVSDGSLSVTQQFKATVVEANRSPTLEPISDVALDEGALLQITAAGADPNVPAQMLTYALGAGAPEGVVIDPASGVLTWTPTESQGPGVYQIGVLVTDDGTPPLSAARSFVATVREVNRAPEIVAIEDKVINVGGFLVFTVPATDEDIPNQTLTYSLGAGAPAGAEVSAGGLFTWTPGAAQVFTTNHVALIVSDGSLSVTQAFIVTVVEANRSPTLQPISDVTIIEGEPFQITAVGADSNVPAQTLAYSLGAGAPEGVAIDPATGVFTWTPTESQGPGVYQIGVLVTDDGTPPLSAARSFVATVSEVNRAPEIAAIEDKVINVGGLLVFTVPAMDEDIPNQTLIYSLGAGAPAGAEVSAGGLFTWTPGAAQVFTTNHVALIVSDGSLSVTQVVTMTVVEANRSPTLAAIGDVTISEGELLQITALGADSNVPAQILTYSLGAGAPEGLVIDAASGLLTWTPTESQGPVVYQIGVLVTDNGTPPLSAARSFVATVSEVNRPPEIAAIEDKVINVGGLLVFTAPATDQDIPQQTLTYALGAGAPVGAEVSSGGLFTWTPGAGQARTTNQIKLIVSDGSLSATQAFSVVVFEVNLAPTLAAITNRTVNPGELLTFIVSAVDTNVPAQLLTYSLGTGAPAGASIDPLSGVFAWIPGASAAGTTNLIGVLVTDNGLPPLSASQSFTVFVSGSGLVPPRLVNPVRTGSNFSASLNSLSGRKYFFERNHSGVSSGWQLLGELPGNGGIITLTDPTATNANSIYRARVE